MSTNFLFSKSLAGKLNKSQFLKEETKFNVSVGINNEEYKIVLIECNGSEVNLSIEAPISAAIFKQDVRIDYLSIHERKYIFRNKMNAKFSKLVCKDSINFSLCTIVIDEKTFWSEIENG
jgi:sRNA-binding carbon storage regulator CsrA